MDAQIAHDEGDEYFFREGCHITDRDGKLYASATSTLLIMQR